MVDLISGYSNKKKSKHIKKLVLFLHGYGADGSDLINISNIWEEFLPEVAFYSPNAPFKCEINPYGYQWFSLNERTENEIKSGLEITGPYVKKYVEHILNENNLELKDLLIVGFSQGTMLALNHFTKQEFPCAGIIGYSGLFHYSEKDIRAHDFPIQLYHGELDDVVNHSYSIKAYQDLKSLGYNVDYSLAKNLGHSIDENGLKIGIEFIKKVFKV